MPLQLDTLSCLYIVNSCYDELALQLDIKINNININVIAEVNYKMN